MEGIPTQETPKNIYEDENFVTLYRYENPDTSYDETREGTVSRQELVGQWYTDNLNDLKTYVKSRQPGGKLVAVRIRHDELESHDASKLDGTKDMDIEKGNYIISDAEAENSRIEIPLAIEAINPKKFLMSDWQKVNKFVDTNLSPENLVERSKLK